MADGITWEDGKSWRTILIVPYGRGGAGFSVLDVTYPLVKEGQGPMHMFSVYNDAINNKVLIATGLGAREELPYFPEYIKWEDSREAQRAVENQLDAEDTDGADSTTQQDAIFSCQTQADTSSDFALNGDNACYRGTQFSFDFSPPEDVTITTSDFRYYESRDDVTGKKPSAVSSSDGIVTVLARRNGREWSRLGMAISRKCAPRAVDRNRLKRIIRESFRHSRDQLQGLDLVVIGKRKRPLANSRDLAQSLEQHWLVVSERCKRC